MKTSIPPSDEDRRKHLEFIQAIVTRMSAASANAKSWLLPVVTAAYGFAVTEKSQPVALIGMAGVLLFMYVDANYLRLERSFRSLYDTVAHHKREIPIFSLDPAEVSDPTPVDMPRIERFLLIVRRWIPEWPIWFSWSIFPFYGAFLIIGVTIWFHARTR